MVFDMPTYGELLGRAIDEIMSGDKVYYIPEEKFGSSAQWPDVIKHGKAQRLVKRVWPTKPNQ
jgi:hypothetical protein